MPNIPIIFAPPRPATPDPKTTLIDAIKAKVAALLATGFPITRETLTLHMALDDGSRADLTAMATTAIAAAAGSLPWPQSYAQGWISTENIRIPLLTPIDGLLLAAGAGDFYAKIVQHGRDLKDAVLANASAPETGRRGFPRDGP